MPVKRDNERLRSVSVIVVGTCLLLLPIVVARMSVPNLLLVSAIGALTVLPVWRHIGGSLNAPLAAVAFFGLVIGMLVVGRVFSAVAIWTFVGAWAVTWSAIRLVYFWPETNWRE